MSLLSVTGSPAITVPVALTKQEGLPLGIQLAAAPMQEARLLAVAHVLERAVQADFGESDDLMRLHACDEGKAPISTV